MDFSFSDLNSNSVENLPGFEARAAFLCYGKALRDDPVNSASVFREDVDIVRGCIKKKHLVHPLVFYVAENAIYVKRSKFSYFSKIFDSQGAKSEIKAKTDRLGAYFPHFESVWLLLNTFSLS